MVLVGCPGKLARIPNFSCDLQTKFVGQRGRRARNIFEDRIIWPKENAAQMVWWGRRYLSSMVFPFSPVPTHLQYRTFQETEPSVDEGGQAHGKRSKENSLSTEHSVAQKAAETRQIRVGFTYALIHEGHGEIEPRLNGRRPERAKSEYFERFHKY